MVSVASCKTTYKHWSQQGSVDVIDYWVIAAADEITIIFIYKH